MTDILEAPAVSDVIAQLPVDELVVSDRNRAVTEDDVDDIVASARVHGILEPLLVHEQSDGSYELIAGARRRMAAIVCGFEHVPCIIRTGLTEREVVELRLIENVGRRQLHPLDEAELFAELRHLGASQADIGALLSGKSKMSQPTVSKRLSLLALSDRAKILFRCDQLNVEQAEALAKLCKKAPARADVVLDQVETDARNTPNVLAQQLREHKAEEDQAAKIAELQRDGVAIVDDYGWQDTDNVPLSKIGVSAEEHASEPCHAAVVETGGRVTWVCTDMRRHAKDQHDDSDDSTSDDATSVWEQQRVEREAQRVAAEEAAAERLASIQVTIAATRSKAFALDYLVDQIVPDEILYTLGQQTAEALGLETEDVDVDALPDVLRAYIAEGGDNVAYFAIALAFALGESNLRYCQHTLEGQRAIQAHFEVLKANGYELLVEEQELIDRPIEVGDDETEDDDEPEHHPLEERPEPAPTHELTESSPVSSFDPDDGYDDQGFPLPKPAVEARTDGLCEASGHDYNLAANASDIACPRCAAEINTDAEGRVLDHEPITS